MPMLENSTYMQFGGRFFYCGIQYKLKEINSDVLLWFITNIRDIIQLSNRF